ncbi:hypothetical protein J3459_011057 [Metarhizium acridum]|nr:hypothetical protein J3459_011057 [Metarhizium acridum]
MRAELSWEKTQLFEQPVLQTAQMFVGEMGCWLVIALRWLRIGASSLDRPPRNAATKLSTTTDNAEHEEQRNRPSQTGDCPSVLRGFRVILLALPAIAISAVPPL